MQPADMEGLSKNVQQAPSALPGSQVKTILQQLSNVLDQHIDSKLKAHNYVGLQLPNQSALGSASPLKGIYRPSSEQPEAGVPEVSASSGTPSANAQAAVKNMGGGVTQVQLNLKGDTAMRSRCRLVSTSGQADLLTGVLTAANTPAKVVVFDPDAADAGHILDGAALPADVLPEAPQERVLASIVSLKARMMGTAAAPSEPCPPAAECSGEFHLDLVGVSRPGDAVPVAKGPSVRANRTLPDLSRIQRKFNKEPLQRFASSNSIPDVNVPPSPSSNPEAVLLSRGIDGLISVKSGRSSYSGAPSSSAGGTPTSSAYGGGLQAGMPAYRASCSGVLCAEPQGFVAGQAPRSRLAAGIDRPYRASTGGSALDGLDNVRRQPAGSPLQPTKPNRQSISGIGNLAGLEGASKAARQSGSGADGVLWRGNRLAASATSLEPPRNSLIDCVATGKHALVLSYEKSAKASEVTVPLDPKNLAFSAAGGTSVTGTYVYGRRDRFKSSGGNSPA